MSDTRSLAHTKRELQISRSCAWHRRQVFMERKSEPQAKFSRKLCVNGKGATSSRPSAALTLSACCPKFPPKRVSLELWDS